MFSALFVRALLGFTNTYSRTRNSKFKLKLSQVQISCLVNPDNALQESCNP